LAHRGFSCAKRTRRRGPPALHLSPPLESPLLLYHKLILRREVPRGSDRSAPASSHHWGAR
jgi:hypothetical protein